MKPITLDDEIAELDRELKMRLRLYPEWSKGPTPKLKPAVAEHRIASIEATLKRLQTLKAAISGEQTILFSA